MSRINAYGYPFEMASEIRRTGARNELMARILDLIPPLQTLEERYPGLRVTPRSAEYVPMADLMNDYIRYCYKEKTMEKPDPTCSMGISAPRSEDMPELRARLERIAEDANSLSCGLRRRMREQERILEVAHLGLEAVQHSRREKDRNDRIMSTLRELVNPDLVANQRLWLGEEAGEPSPRADCEGEPRAE